MSWLEHKYVGLVSGKLQRFAKRGGHYNFRCPFCGDSQKSKTKTRGYLYEKTGPRGPELVFHCHNCSVTYGFKKFLELTDHGLYEEYLRERFTDVTPNTQCAPVPAMRPAFSVVGPLKQLKRVSQLSPSHPAKLYIERRKIPSKMHYKLFYAPSFKRWVNTLIPGKFEHEDNDEPRLVIPFLDRSGTLYGFQGRSFKPDGLRYITIMLDDSQPKIFGWDTVDLAQPVYVVEGPIDSMFVDNCVAMAGSDMSQACSKLSLDPQRTTVVMDNEPRNKQIVDRMRKFVSSGFKVCVWPQHIKEKDINDMILAGLSSVDLKLVIDENAFRGLRAEMELVHWSKC